MKKILSALWSEFVFCFKVMFKICICKSDELFVDPDCSAEEHKNGKRA